MKIKHTYIFAFALIAFLAACGNKKEQEKQAQAQANAPVPISVFEVKEDNVVGTDTYPGTVVSLNEVELRAQVSGYITKIYIKEGQFVKKGQPLYEIDQSKYQAIYRQAQANLRSSEAALIKAAKDADRYQKLAEKDAVAKQRVDYALTDLQTAKAQVAASQAEVRNVATDLGYSTIRAPFSGRIGLTQVRLGAQVTPGTTLLNTISSDDPVAVDFVIDDNDIPRFTALEKNSGKMPDSLFTLAFINREKYNATGSLETIDRAVDPQTGTIKVRLKFPNPKRELIVGMSCLVEVKNPEIGVKPVIPSKAVTEQMGEFFVYFVNDSNKVEQRKVTMGTRFKDMVVITKGLKKGEKIAVDGIQKLKQGTPVQVGDVKKPQASQTK